MPWSSQRSFTVTRSGFQQIQSETLPDRHAQSGADRLECHRGEPVKLLLVNPPIYDFTAFDFWLRPYGLLRVGGRLRAHESTTFDYLVSQKRDTFGRGRFDQQLMPKPGALADIPRRFYRFGRPR